GTGGTHVPPRPRPGVRGSRAPAGRDPPDPGAGAGAAGSGTAAKEKPEAISDKLSQKARGAVAGGPPMKEELRQLALEYHRWEPAGKLAIRATKPLANQRDLSLAYSPGVAAACEAIVNDAEQAPLLTTRGN